MNHAMVAVAAVGFSIVLGGCQQTPKDYDECVLENVKSGMGETAVSAIQQSCAVKYPDKADEDVNADRPNVKIKKSEWHKLRDGLKKPDGVSFYIDKNSIETLGKYRYFWIKSIKDKGGVKSPNYDMEHVYADCSNKTLTEVEFQTWKNSRKIKQINPYSTDAVTPDTFASSLYNYVCSYNS
jgi:hypothetical protein